MRGALIGLNVVWSGVAGRRRSRSGEKEGERWESRDLTRAVPFPHIPSGV